MMGTFTRNATITFVVQVIALILSVLISVIIARALGPEGRGIFSLALLLPAFLVYFTSSSIGQAAIYYLGKEKYRPAEVLGNNIIIAIITGIVSVILGVVIILFFGDELFPNVPEAYLFLTLISLPFQLIFGYVSFILLGLQKVAAYNYFSLFRVCLLLVMTSMLLLIFNYGVAAVIVSEALSFIIPCIVLFYVVRRYTGGLTFRLNHAYMKDAFSYGTKIYIGNVLSFINYRSGIWMVGIFLNPSMVGFYSTAMGLSEKLWMVPDAVATVLFPRISSLTDNVTKDFTPLVLRNVLAIVTVLATGMLIVSYWIIVLLYSSAFLGALEPFRIMLIGVVAISGWKIIESDLKGRGKPLLSTYLNLTCAAVTVVLNIVLIPAYGTSGAAWASTISYVTAFMVALVFYIVISGNKIADLVIIKKSDLVYYSNIFKSLVLKK